MDAVNKLQSERQAAGQASDLIDCLQMGDKRDLLLSRSDLCRELGLPSKNQADRRLKKAEKLRNLLAHGQHNLVDGSSWEELFDLAEWLEQLVQTSDSLVEARAPRPSSRAGGARLSISRGAFLERKAVSGSAASASIMRIEFPIPVAREIFWRRGRGLRRLERCNPRVRMETSAPPVLERKRSLGSLLPAFSFRNSINQRTIGFEDVAVSIQHSAFSP